MCGINGIVSLRGETENYGVAVEGMNAALAHRGPNDHGVFSENGVTLGHRRLSIIDLSTAGHQPMQSADGRYVLVFNGEIYNFRELRSQLDYPFRSHSDTEVLLAAWHRWGPACIERFVGMFAFAVWDRVERELHLVRDRLGIKPLYYHQDAQRLVFSSEVRAVLASQLVPGKVNRDGLVDYLRYQSVHQPDTIVEGVRMLPPGCCLEVHKQDVKVQRYWSPLQVKVSENISAEEARKKVFEALLKAVERRLVADVPFGAFLSGGIDSSVIVALMSKVTDKVSTFSITFAEEEFSEARYARMVAEKFHTDHHEINLSPRDFLELLPEALDRMDHPSGDGPNTYVVSKATKNAGVTMALSGLGGDELFAGYPIFQQSARLQKLSWLNLVPLIVRKAAGRAIQAARPSIAAAKIAGILEKPRITALSAYPFYRQVFLDRQIVNLVKVPRLPANRVDKLLDDLGSEAGFSSLPSLSQVSVAEMSTYMQNVLLRDTDQMSMAHALEVRVPFLDHELVELVLGLPDHLKYPHAPKRLLVESMGDLLPSEIVNRPKMGFVLPFERWMKREMRDFCDQRVQRLAAREQFNGGAMKQYWTDFLDGKQTVSWSRMWMLVVLEHWLEKNGVS
jgi:asparagine synthase (glutamine-hydrolysing)